MNDLGYPQYGKSQRLGRSGESFIDHFVQQKLGWLYRSVHQEYDFGIDGYIDIVNDERVTGQTIALQIKCGDSYFNKKTEGGIRYEGENKHLNYYLNCPFPIVFVVLNSDCSEGKWIEFNPNITLPKKVGWWIEIPNINVLDSSVKDTWASIAGPVLDHSDKLALTWKVNEAIDNSDFGVYIVHKDDIKACDFTGIKDVIDRLSKNKESLLKKRGSLEVLIAGYDDDHREVYEIPEVRRWYFESIKAGIPWFYFLGKCADGMGLTVFLFSSCDIEIKTKANGDTYVELKNVDQIDQWIKENFNNLNRFVDKNNIPDEINKEMSEQAISLVKSKFINIKG